MTSLVGVMIFLVSIERNSLIYNEAFSSRENAQSELITQIVK